jgi:hypothetical protein
MSEKKEKIMRKEIKPVDLSKIKTRSIKNREHKTKIKDFIDLDKFQGNFDSFFQSLPNILKAYDLKELVEAVVTSRKNNKPVILATGDAVIKVGLSPLIIKLIKEGIITAVALQGAGAIHDTEIALIGETSEDVAASIQDGTFGMVEETGSFLNKAINEGAREKIGLGEAVGKKIINDNLPFKDYSILASCYKQGIPATVHVAIGTDTIHMHPEANGEAIGATSHLDFKIFASCIQDLSGGVIMNVASAVILPEVFLKALSVARNISEVGSFTAANFDMIMHYRPTENIVKRPIKSGGKGYNITGHLEIMLPLFAKALLGRLKK